MPRKDSNGYWLNARGKAIPPEFIDPVVKNREKAVERSFKKIEQLAKRMQKIKEEVDQIITNHMAYVDQKTGVDVKTKGNLTLTNFSGDLQIEVRVNDVIDFDSRLQNAKSLIDECITDWSKGSNQNISVLVSQAFEVDKKGTLNVPKVLGLRAIKIKDKKWQRAMDLIAESLQVSGTRRYILFKEREGGIGGKWDTWNLNFSSL